MKTALLAGATGLIGAQLLQLLLADGRYHRVKAVTRTPVTFKDVKLENIVVDFERLDEHANQLIADDIFCCLGTTMKQAGSAKAFEKVDLHYPVALAKIGKTTGAQQYFLVSALGASRNASVYYNRIKGETEEAIASIGFTSYHIFRPSLLLGNRKEKRAGEDAAKVVYQLFGFLIPKKYKGIDAARVARAMLYFAKREQHGTHIHESAALQEFLI